VAGGEVVGAEAGEGAVDDALREIRRCDPEPLDDTGPEALEHHVCFSAESATGLRIRLQVDLDRFLAGVQGLVPGRRELAHRVTAGRLQPHDSSAEPQQLAARERPG